MTVYSTNEHNKYKAPRGDSRIDPRRLESLERENMVLRGEVRKHMNIANIAQRAYDQKSKIAQILFDNKESIPEGLYVELMNSLI